MSRCSARWITRVINKVASVATACQSRLSLSKRNHRVAYRSEYGEGDRMSDELSEIPLASVELHRALQ